MVNLLTVTAQITTIQIPDQIQLSNMSKDSESSRLELALADCRQQAIPNFKATAARYSVNRTTLSRRFHGTQRSYIESRSESIRNLTIDQEEVLIDFINRRTDRALPPTSQIVKNVAEELCGKEVSKN